MTKRSLATLLAINVILLSALVLVMFGNPQPAEAQFGGGGRYLMIAGRSPQRENQAAVYIIDVNSSKIAAIVVNTAVRRNNIEPVAGRTVRDDAQRAQQMRSR